MSFLASKVTACDKKRGHNHNYLKWMPENVIEKQEYVVTKAAMDRKQGFPNQFRVVIAVVAPKFAKIKSGGTAKTTIEHGFNLRIHQIVSQ